MINNNYTKPFAQSGFCALQTNEFLDNQRIAGKIAANVLNTLKNLILNQTTLSAIELSNIAEKIILEYNATPTFKGYNNFPAAICCSVNKTLVHGVPGDYKFQEGDVISFDVGVTYKESIADTATTCIYGKAKDEHIKLINTTKECLKKAIESIAVNKRIGVIGNAIYKTAKASGFSIVDVYGGHGISRNELHATPFVSNKSDSNEGFRIQPNLVLAIEPLLVIGNSNSTYKDRDGSVICSNICAHEEHTVFIHNDKVEIIT